MIGYRYQDKKGSRAPSMVEKIFGWYYRCLVPALQSRTIEDIRERGVIVTGIKDLDEGLRNDWVKQFLTINQMVELYKRGVSIRIVDIKDTKDIYNTIQTHLTMWIEQLRVGLNIGDAPMEDLMAMDKFAGTVYPHAVYLFTPEALESALGEQIMNVQRLNMTNFFSQVSPTGEVTKINPLEDNQPKMPERESFEEKFKQSAMSLRRY